MAAGNASLVVSFEGNVVDEVSIGGARVTLGRGPHNTILLDDPAVSGRHAAIVFDAPQETGPVLVDLGSTNGIRVNGARVTRHVLKHGDIIDIGRHRLRYLEEQTINEPLGDAAVARIRVLNGPDVGRETELAAATVPLGEPGGAQAVIERRGDGYVVARAGEGETPLRNGAPIGTSAEALARGDVIEVAGIGYEFLAV